MEAKENMSSSEEWSVGEHIDCLDTINKWCNAEITHVRTSPFS